MQNQNQNYSTKQKEEKSEQFLTLPTASIQCRICLQNMNQSSLETISPCICSGTLKYVHEQCLQSWIKKIINVNYQDEEGKKKNRIPCQICKQWVIFETERSVRCRSLNEISSYYIQNRTSFIFMMVLFLVNLGIFSALLNYLILHGFQSLGDKNPPLIILIMSGTVIIGLVVVTTLSFLIKKFLFISELIVLKIENGKKSKNKTLPQDEIGKKYLDNSPNEQIQEQYQ